jgi:hypothetical protein
MSGFNSAFWAEDEEGTRHLLDRIELRAACNTNLVLKANTTQPSWRDVEMLCPKCRAIMTRRIVEAT